MSVYKITVRAVGCSAKYFHLYCYRNVSVPEARELLKQNFNDSYIDLSFIRIEPINILI